MSKFVFEISWEVCNKVGGIHTVISSKVHEAKKNFENYYCVGNYIHAKKENFIEHNVPNEFRKVFEKVKKMGIDAHYGIWKINEETNCILIDYSNYTTNTPIVKKELWEQFKIDSLNSTWYDYDEAIIWSWCCGILIEELSLKLKNDDIFLHAHEWMSGGAIFYCKTQENSRVKTVFTTHATMLGRSISGNNINLYDLEKNIDPNKFAYSLNVHTKHQSETVLAKISDCFTTVSDITAKETEFFYSKKPDIILYNGFNTQKMNYDFSREREHINEFLKAYFYLNSPIDVDNTQVIFTSGRNEVRNKGVDILISSLAKLNEHLKRENSPKAIVCFILLLIGDFKEDPLIRNSFDAYKNKSQSAKKKYTPLSTHEIPTDNPIIKQLFSLGLCNREDDKVKIILNPKYLDSNDGFFNRQYYEITSGCDLSVFASFYEPWGYTPLESISCGVPTITSDLAGFGLYLQDKGFNNCFLLDDKKSCSIEVLKREGKSYDEAVDSLFFLLQKFSNKTAKELYFEKEVSKELSKQFDWSKFYKNYLEAYEFASKKALNTSKLD